MAMTNAHEWLSRLGPATLRAERPRRWVGVAVAVLAVTLATLAIVPLERIARVESLGVVYLPAVLLISTYWGLGLGLVTSLLSAAAFNFLPPAAGRPIHDLRQPQLGRAGRIHRRRRHREHHRRAGAFPRHGGRAAPGRSGPGRRPGPRAPARRRHCHCAGERGPPGRRGAGAAVR